MKIDIGIDHDARLAISEGLSKLLSDTFVLYLKTHQFHWNVTGPMFNTLHTMCELQYNEMWTATDAIAERIRSLGEHTPGSFAQFIALSAIKETATVPTANDMIKLLVEGHETLVRTVRAIFAAAEKGGDEATADLLTQRLQIHEKTAWMLRAMLDKQ